MTNTHKIIAAVVLFLIAGVLILWQLKPPPVPGQGMPCQIECPKGHTTPTSWDKLWSLPALDRRVDTGPNGKMYVKCPTCGEWSPVKNLAPVPQVPNAGK